MRWTLVVALAAAGIGTIAASDLQDRPTTSGISTNPGSDSRRSGDQAVYHGRIGRDRLRIPAALVLPTVISREGPDWKSHPAEPNNYRRQIRYFDLRLVGPLPDSTAVAFGEGSLNRRGFVEADAFVVPPSQVSSGIGRQLGTDLAGKGLGGT